MKIVIIARTRNESRNIYKFCRAYNWADSILIADGGSLDNTTAIASGFSNVKIRRFREKIWNRERTLWRNPHGRHINFMIRWAEKEGADWIIFDDVDCFPTISLSENIRAVLESTSYNFVMVNRVYMVGNDGWFEDITLPTGKWETSTSLYGWRNMKSFYANESNPWEHDFQHIQNDQLHLHPPMGVIHDYYPVGDIRMDKVKFYRESGEQWNCKDPMDYGGRILPREAWMEYE